MAALNALTCTLLRQNKHGPRSPRQLGLSIDGQIVPLTVDTTAPLGFLEANATRHGMNGLFKPGQADKHGGLPMIELYQRGKIPVVFIYGLASDPLTWGSMANDVFINKDLLDRFQFWIFSYPTGAAFPREAYSATTCSEHTTP